MCRSRGKARRTIIERTLHPAHHQGSTLQDDRGAPAAVVARNYRPPAPLPAHLHGPAGTTCAVLTAQRSKILGIREGMAAGRRTSGGELAGHRSPVSLARTSKTVRVGTTDHVAPPTRRERTSNAGFTSREPSGKTATGRFGPDTRCSSLGAGSLREGTIKRTCAHVSADHMCSAE